MATGNPQWATALYDFAQLQSKKNALKPEWAIEIAKRNVEELGSFSMLITTLGAEMTPMQIGAESIYTMEKGPTYPPYTVRVQPAATGAGADVTVSILDATPTAPFYTPVRVNEDIAHPFTKRKAKVVSITSVAAGNTTFVVRPHSSTDDWALIPILPGQKLPRFGQTMGDISHGVDTLVGDLDVYQFFRSQLRESFNISGTALTQGQLWFGGQAWTLDMIDWNKIFQEQIDRFILTAQPDTTQLAATSPVSNMTFGPVGACGVIPAINGDMIFAANPNGHPGGVTINTGGPLQLSHLQSFSRTQKNLGNNCRNYVLAGDQNLKLEFEEMILSRGGTVDAWGPLRISGGIEIGKNFHRLIYDNITYTFVEVDAFNTEFALGGPGSGYSNYGILIPVDKFVKNYLDGPAISRMGMFNGGPTRHRYWATGSIFPDTFETTDNGMTFSKIAPTVGWGRGDTDLDKCGFQKLTEMGFMYYDMSYFGQIKR